LLVFPVRAAAGVADGYCWFTRIETTAKNRAFDDDPMSVD